MADVLFINFIHLFPVSVLLCYSTLSMTMPYPHLMLGKKRENMDLF